MKSVYTTQGNSVAVSNIFCIGRNYAAHIAELGNQKEEQPIVFLKPTSSVHLEGTPVVLPDFSNDIHYETELVLLIGKGGKNITPDHAQSHIAGYGLGLDLTARDLQSTAKNKGLPWSTAKGFDGAACLSKFIDASQLTDPKNIKFNMKLNGIDRQQGDTAFMLFDIPFLISYLSHVFTLSPGDLIFTGTPEGVGPLKSSDSIDLEIPHLLTAHFDIQ